MKLVCSECGCDLMKNGIIMDAVQIANYNEKEDAFVYDDDMWTIEAKCPECFSMTGLPNARIKLI